MKKILLLVLVLSINTIAGWMNVDSINVKQKFRNKKFNTDALLYIKSADSLLDTCNMYYVSGAIGIGISSPSYLLDVNGDAHINTDLLVSNDITLDGVLSAQDYAVVSNYLTIGDGTYPLQIVPHAGAAYTSTNQSYIATTVSFAGLTNGSIFLQPASIADSRSIAFLGGTTGKITAQIFDTTSFNIFTDSTNIAGDLYIDGTFSATSMALEKLDVDTLIVNDSIYNAGDSYLAGSVGIGTNDPTGIFHVYSATSGQIVLETSTSSKYAIGAKDSYDGLYFYDYTSTNQFATFRNNSLGLLTEDPQEILHVNGNIRIEEAGLGTDYMTIGRDASYSYIQAENSEPLYLNPSGNNIGIVTNYISNTGATSKGIKFDASNRPEIYCTAGNYGNIGYGLAIWDDAAYAQGNGGGILFGGVDSSDGSFATYAGIRGYKANATDGNNAGQLHFQVKAHDVNPVTRMIINEYGQMGVGQTPSTDRLEVNGTTNTDSLYVSGDSYLASNLSIGSNTQNLKLTVRTDVSDDGIILERLDGTDIVRIFKDASSSDARIDMSSGGVATIQLRANGISHFSGGNVGINDATPSYQLDVGGVIHTSSNIYLDNNNSISQFNSTGTLRQILALNDHNYLKVGGVVDSGIIFYSNLGNPRMYLAHSGNFGIGVSDPDQKLEVNGAIKSSATSDQLKIQAYDQTTKDWRFGTNTGNSGANPNLTLWYTDTSNVMLFDTVGNVGIGTVTPDARLTIADDNYTTRIRPNQYDMLAVSTDMLHPTIYSLPDYAGVSAIHRFLSFDATTEEGGATTVGIPAEAKDTLYVSLLTLNTAGGSGTYVFKMYYELLGVGNTLVSTMTDSLHVVTAATTADVIDTMVLGKIPIQSNTTGLAIHLSRDATTASDNYANDILVPLILFEYNVDKLGDASYTWE